MRIDLGRGKTEAKQSTRPLHEPLWKGGGEEEVKNPQVADLSSLFVRDIRLRGQRISNFAMVEVRARWSQTSEFYRERRTNRR